MNVFKYVLFISCFMLLLPLATNGEESDTPEVLDWADRIASNAPSQSDTPEVLDWADRIASNAPSQQASQIDQAPIQLQTEGTLYVEYGILQERNRLWLLIALVGSTPILIFLVLFFMKNNAHCSSENLVTAVGLILVVEGTMFICVASETSEELTAPIGILGAIAGYLFGSAKKRGEENADNEKKLTAQAAEGQ